jgi:hypothetical protein
MQKTLHQVHNLIYAWAICPIIFYGGAFCQSTCGLNSVDRKSSNNPWPCSFLQQKLDKLLDIRGTLFKLLNGVFRTKTLYMLVVLTYQINLFFKFVIIKTQLITHYYHLFYVKHNLYLSSKISKHHPGHACMWRCMFVLDMFLQVKYFSQRR